MARKADKTPEVNAVHACGHLGVIGAGVMEGSVEFPVRGAIQFRMERRPNDHKGECARLVCLKPYSQCDMVLIQELDMPEHWWGEIPIEGYHYLVRVQKDGRKMAVQFLDVKQPKWCDEAAEILGKVA